MKIAMVASEACPLAKTGGLGDVVYSLSKELVSLKEEVIIILPYYESIKKQALTFPTYVGEFQVNVSWRRETAQIYEVIIDDIKFYLIDNPKYFGRSNFYGEFDDGERFAFFTFASRALFSYINYIPDIIHIHDWQVGMLPVIVREDKHPNNPLKDTKFVLTIHNPAFQGLLPSECVSDLYGLPSYLYENGTLRFKEQFSTLKSGIVYVDKITTVSPTHRYELLTREGSMGLDGILNIRESDFVGILNGIDVVEFDPSKDEYIDYPFNKVNFFKNKALNKEILLKELGIEDHGQPLFSIVSRLTWQKGMDLVFAACTELARRGCNIIILGSGEYQYEQMAEQLRAIYPNLVAVYIGYNNELAHQIYAASDFFFMPSLFEPCGIGQLIAMRYGTLPIVRRTGGLRDSVEIYNGENKDIATGFGFDAYSHYEMVRTSIYAYDNYWDLPLRKQLIKNAMKFNSTWTRSAKAYLKVYKSIK